MSDEEIVSRILGLPLERIEYLKQNHGLVCDEAGFDMWFVENAVLVLSEKKRQFNAEMGVPQDVIPTSSDRATLFPSHMAVSTDNFAFANLLLNRFY